MGENVSIVTLDEEKMSRSLGPYHTLEELTGQKVVIADLLQKLAKIPRSDVLRCLSGLSALLERVENSTLPQQIRLLHEIVPSDLANTVEAALKKETEPGIVFHRRQVWFVMQMALLTCKGDETSTHDEATLKEIGTCCLMGNDVLKEVENVVQFQPDETQSLAYMIAALITYTELAFGSEVFARAQLFWLEMVEDDSVRQVMKDHGIKKTPSEEFEAGYGIPLKEFMHYVLVLYHAFAKSTLTQRPSALMYDPAKAFQGIFQSEHTEKALKILSATPDQVAVRLLGSPRQSWSTDSSALVKTPLIELEPNKYVCPDLHMFRAFFAQGMFELLADVMHHDKLKSLLAGLFERYIERLMHSFAPTSAVLANTYFHCVEFVSSDTAEACDGLLLWPSFAVLLECKTNMLTTRQRHAMSLHETTKAIDDQIATFDKCGERKPGEKKKRKGIGQLAYNLARIFAGEQVKHNGKPIDLSGVTKFYPAIVVYDEGMANYAVRLHLQIQMTDWFKANNIDHSRVGHALLFTIRDIEFFEKLTSTLGAEKVMRDYVNYVEAHPRDPYSMFHEYALNRYKEAHTGGGYTLDTVDRVLTAVDKETERRKALLAKQ